MRVDIGTNWLTSSPSPIHRPSRAHADQFHGYPPMDKMILSIASSRLSSRERKRPFLSNFKHETSRKVVKKAARTGTITRGQ